MTDGIFKRNTKIDFTGFFIKYTQEDAKMSSIRCWNTFGATLLN